MKLASDIEGGTSKLRVKVKEIDGEKIKCNHISSGFEVTAYIKSNTKLEIGQIILIEYRKNLGSGGYVLYDDLMEEINATVLEAQHIISDGMMYTSLILENPTTKQRLHSLVPSNNKLFGNTSIIITGDIVKVRVNNGNLFSIQT